MSVTLGPPPFQSAVSDPKTGMMTSIWQKYLVQMYLRVGGASASSNSDFTASINTLNSEVAANTASISTLTTDFSNLSVGRQL